MDEQHEIVTGTECRRGAACERVAQSERWTRPERQRGSDGQRGAAICLVVSAIEMLPVYHRHILVLHCWDLTYTTSLCVC